MSSPKEDRSFMRDDDTPAEISEREFQRGMDKMRTILAEAAGGRRPKVLMAHIVWEDDHLDGCAIGDIEDMVALCVMMLANFRETTERLMEEDSGG